jgi:hypothetical protein
MCVLTETLMWVCDIHSGPFEGIAVLTYSLPDDWNPGVPKHVGKETAYQMHLLLSARKVG